MDSFDKLNLMNDLDDDIIEEAAKYRPKKVWKPIIAGVAGIAAVAAAVALFVLVANIWNPINKEAEGGKAPQNTEGWNEVQEKNDAQDSPNAVIQNEPKEWKAEAFQKGELKFLLDAEYYESTGIILANRPAETKPAGTIK